VPCKKVIRQSTGCSHNLACAWAREPNGLKRFARRSSATTPPSNLEIMTCTDKRQLQCLESHSYGSGQCASWGTLLLRLPAATAGSVPKGPAGLAQHSSARISQMTASTRRPHRSPALHWRLPTPFAPPHTAGKGHSHLPARTQKNRELKSTWI